MKKKIIAFSLVIAMVAVAAVSATLAYLTSKDQVVNTFTIGNVKIDLYEYADYDGDGVLNEEKKFQEYLNYSDIMPGDEMPKVPYVENTGANAAYVRVAVVMNNVTPINKAIDGVYEEKEGYDANAIQAIYDYVFDGWGVSYIKRNVNGNNDRRLWMQERNDDELLFDGQIDMYCNQGTYGMYDVNNTFKSETDTDKEGFDYACQGYYHDATKLEERIYVFYLKLAPGEKYKLFDGLNVPTDFDADQLKMFDNLKIAIYADAIQADGFADTTDDNGVVTMSAELNAFNALQDANPLGWWNNN